MNTLTSADIEHIARLARLELTEKEKQQYAEQLSVVLEYMDMLHEVETDEVEETCQVGGLEDVVRPDIVEECGGVIREKIIACFPERVGPVLQVKAVFDV